MISAAKIKELRKRTGVGIVDCKKALEATNEIEDAIQWLKEKGISKGAAKASREALEGVIVIVQNNNIYTIMEVNCETDFVARNKTFIATANKLTKLMQVGLKTKPDKEIKDFLNLESFRIGEKIAINKVKHIQVDDTKTQVGIYVHNDNKKGGLVVIEKPISPEIAEKVAMHVVAMNPLFINRNLIPSEYLEKEQKALEEQFANDKKPKEIIRKIIDGKIRKMFSEIVLEEQQYALSEKKKETILDLTNGSKVLEMYRFEVGVK